MGAVSRLRLEAFHNKNYNRKFASSHPCTERKGWGTLGVDDAGEIKSKGWPPDNSCRGCHSLHSNQMLNRGYAYTTIISSQHHGRTLLSHLASLYPHSSPEVWQQKLNNREVTVNGVTATGSESLTSGQTLVWNRPPWIEPDTPQHFRVPHEKNIPERSFCYDFAHSENAKIDEPFNHGFDFETA